MTSASLRRVWRVVLFVFAAFAVMLGTSTRANADDVAPELEASDLRQHAASQLRALVAGLSPGDQRRLVGIYTAFDPNPNDPFVMAACDDDGDDVILFSDAMLRLAANVARAESYDDTSSSRRIEEYASFLARSQVPGRRLLPPPPGFFVAQKAAPTYEAHLREILSFLVARELVHFRTGDLACPHPTMTKESGDEVWTPAEMRKALETATTLYPGNIASRDSEAIIRVMDGGRSESGAIALLRFFAQFETERIVIAGRFQPTYLIHHPSSVMRASSVQATAKQHRSQD